jgi:MFS family permease
VKKIKWFTLLNNVVLFAPLAFMIRSNKGLSGSEIFILQAVLAICIVLLEVPSGYLADRLGYKKTIIIAQIALLASRTVFLFGEGFGILIWDVIFLAVSNSMLSGVIDAYIYESNSETYANESAKIYNFGTYGFIGSNILFGAVILAGEKWLIGGTLIANVLALLIALTIPASKSKKPLQNPDDEKAHYHLSDFKLAFKHTQFWVLSFLNATIGVGMVIFNLLFIMLLTKEGFQPALFGGVILVYAILELVVKYTDDLAKRFGKERCIEVLFAAIGAVFLGIASISNISVLIVLGGLVLPLLIMLSILISEMNNHFVDGIGQEHQRVTLLSIFNLMGRVFEMVFFFLIAFGLSSFSVVFLSMGVVYMVATGVGWMYRVKGVSEVQVSQKKFNLDENEEC